VPQLRPIGIQRVAIDVTEAELADEFLQILRARGLTVDKRSITATGDKSGLVIGQVLEQLPTPAATAQLGEHIAEHAGSGRPPVLFVPPAPRKRGKADESAACVALLQAHGAVVTSDPEVWVECLVLLAAYGPPSGPRTAIVAPAGSWLAAAAAAQARRAEHLGERFTALAPSRDSQAATDLVLVDTTEMPTGERDSQRLIVPVAGRAHICADRPVLVGLASALSATELCGQATRRIAAGDGAAPMPGVIEDFDHTRFQRQLDKLSERVGDHESKVLLSSYGITITRQAVATTPSAATRIAKKAGYPVEIKAWGDHQPSEREGALVVHGIDTAAEVRRAFASVCTRTDSDAVIIRETPMEGRELRISIRQHPSLGLMAFLYQSGHSEPAAALAPLRPVDAIAVAHQVVASRAADRDPDWPALADLLVAASHMVADNERVLGLELSRVILGSEGEGALVVDANATLDSRLPAR
jgi:hypothetical protein